MHFLKEGQKIRAWVDPPLLIRAMPEKNVFFQLISSLRPQISMDVNLTHIFLCKIKVKYQIDLDLSIVSY